MGPHDHARQYPQPRLKLLTLLRRVDIPPSLAVHLAQLPVSCPSFPEHCPGGNSLEGGAVMNPLAQERDARSTGPARGVNLLTSTLSLPTVERLAAVDRGKAEMTYTDWQDAFSAIRIRTSPCDDEQREFAVRIGVKLPKTLPRIVAAARLKSATDERLGLPQPGVTEGQVARLEELASQGSRNAPKPKNAAEAEAWIDYFHLKGRLEALRTLRLKKGDVVLKRGATSEVDEVASIGDDGVVYFAGGRARAWPDELTVVAPAGDTSPLGMKARRTARNRASERSRRQHWSLAKAESLAQYAVAESGHAGDVEELGITIEAAREEGPLQELLQRRPRILASLIRGPQRFCIPKARLGRKYIPDFLLAEVDSSGIRWILVELETPDSATTLATGNNFDVHARKGVSQVKEWREWLQDNLDEARRPVEENGLGLPDIRPQAEGIVLVGRRERLRPNATKLRDQLFEDSRIRMHTYDWLQETLEGALKFTGPWGENPHKL